MKRELEKALRVKSLSQEIIQELLEDRISYKEEDLRQVIEVLARSVNELTDLYLDRSYDHEVVLKGTIMKMRIGLNTVKMKKEIIGK
ncbi:hypothetical protein ACQCT6_06495 [Cytobacillus gottheilii]|uniref:Uncharacterized protein n=1 Tax=Cytobacillus gottheilii TaxID=859144 RepID=A0ABX8FGD4_9BACI|nr:hypothetical protein [Cytobacillus gottheilii]QVY63090.1 hypothetical protein J1899_08635 [Cytobacillus gottheilii]